MAQKELESAQAQNQADLGSLKGQEGRMPIEDWERDEHGNIKVFPLLATELQLFAGTAIGLRLVFPHPADALERPSGSLPLVLSPVQATDLAQALLRAAERASQPAPPDTRKN